MVKQSRLERVAEAESGTLRSAQGGGHPPPWQLLVRLFTDLHFARRVIGKRLGLAVPLETEDRRVLEQVILPGLLADNTVRRVLFVGCDWYTRHYSRTLFSGVDYWTIELDPARRKFGAKQHVVAPLQDLDKHFPPENFDLIVCNGVFGYGLDSRQDCEAAFSQCHRTLRTGGLLLIGWDDIPERAPLPLRDLRSLQQFASWPFPRLGASYVTDTLYRHIYDFYRK